MQVKHHGVISITIANQTYFTNEAYESIPAAIHKRDADLIKTPKHQHLGSVDTPLTCYKSPMKRDK